MTRTPLPARDTCQPSEAAQRVVERIGPRLRMVMGMIEPMEREEAGRPGRRGWLDVDEAWAILMDLNRDLVAIGDSAGEEEEDQP